MNKGLIVRLFLCMIAFSLCLFAYLEKQNELTELRLYMPKLAKEIKSIQEENTRLKYEIEQFENPQNLMQLARDTRFSHLKHPLSKDILTLQEGGVLEFPSTPENEIYPVKPKHTLAVGAN